MKQHEYCLNKLYDSDLKEKYNHLVINEGLLPVKTTSFYLKKVIEEVNAIGKGGPLYRTVFPTEERMRLILQNESYDYINETYHTPIADAPYIIRKYADRVAFLVTEQCLGHCQYCFRSYKLSENKNNDASLDIEQKTRTLIHYLKQNDNINEVILTGGDPLILNKNDLRFILEKLSKWKIRIHTRAIVYDPLNISNALIDLFYKYKVKVVFHINHPYEICKDVERKIISMAKHGVYLFAQYPLLRGINDSAFVQKLLLEKLIVLNVRPLSIFITEPNKYAASFRLNFSRVEQIIDEIQWHTPSWINSVRFVLDTEIGKVRRENIIRRNKTEIVFQREGKEVYYNDIPVLYDIPGNEKNLLWKTAGFMNM
jgi:lysine 2,3-aminomutase